MKTSLKERPAFRCAECGWTTSKWVGRCAECQAWGSVEETVALRSVTTRPGPVTGAAQPVVTVDVRAAEARPTGLAELDRVLGGGLVPGAVVLLAGEPGIGKSTLLLEVAARWAGSGQRALVVTGEESLSQVGQRAHRVDALDPRLFIAAESQLSALLGQVEAVSPSLLVVDSVQTITADDVDGSAGGVTQVRTVTSALIRLAKERRITVVLVGHVTKDGQVAGPRVLEHLVDVVCSFDGERHSRLRMVRAVKNRFGPSDEVGCFDLGDSGLVDLPDPSGLFVTHRQGPMSGTCVTVTLDGRRPLVTEVQALVANSSVPSPRRATSGLDSARVAMVLAVLERRASCSLSNREVFTATVGGARVVEPAGDLAVALAVAGALHDAALPEHVLAVGELGLSGEVRPVAGLGRRLAEAHRLGFTDALVPAGPRAGGADALPAGIRVHRVEHVSAALPLLRR